MKNKTFICYDIYTGEEIYLEDKKIPQLGPYGETKDKRKPRYCEICGKESNDLCYWAITGYHTYLCKRCTDKYKDLA